MADGRSIGWRAVKYLPAVPFLLLLGYHATRVDPYPSHIGVTKRSCSDPSNAASLTFRGKAFCVRPDEAETWDGMWRNEYILMAAFVVCLGISASVRRRGDRVG